MKKFFTIIALGATVLTAGAQKSVQGAGFFDNWSVGLVGGGILPTTHTSFDKFRAGGQFLANNNTTASRTVFDQSNLSLLGKVNFSNLFCGYNGQPRLFEVEGVVGAGWGHNYINKSYGDDANYFTSKFGFNFNFNVGEKKAWTIVNDKDAQLAKLAADNRDLQQKLNDCRNQKPTVQTVTKNSASLEQTVTFRQGKSTVDASQLPNVERVATFLKNHKNSTVDIKGYASPEGSAEINAKIAKARAEAVKSILVNKYKIAASRINAEGQGVGNMFSENDWNRVSICTINESK